MAQSAVYEVDELPVIAFLASSTSAVQRALRHPIGLYGWLPQSVFGA